MNASVSTTRAMSVAVLLACALLLSACATAPASTDALASDADRQPGASLDAIGQVAFGDIAMLEPGNPLGALKARVIDEYHAASGRRCRRVTIAEREPRLRVVCRTAAGHWTLSRALLSRRLHPQTTL